MKRFRAKAIVLSRTNYGEADRIFGFITPDHGKLKAMAKGVRKSQSKLAGGLELFSISDVSFIPGRKEINTVVSTRLIKHYGQIVKDLDRTNACYSLMKRLDKATEDGAESDYFYLMQNAFEALDDPAVDLGLIELWFNVQLLRLAGHTPNLRTAQGAKLLANKSYSFDFDNMWFYEDRLGKFNPNHIKFLRLGFSPNSAQALNRIKDVRPLVSDLQPITQSMLQAYIRV